MSPTNDNLVNRLIDTHGYIMGCAYGPASASKAASDACVAKHCDTSDAKRSQLRGSPHIRTFTTDALLCLGGNVDYKPNAHMAWSLWAMRTQAGSGLLPVTFEGDALIEAEAKAESKLIALRYEVDS